MIPRPAIPRGVSRDPIAHEKAPATSDRAGGVELHLSVLASIISLHRTT
jgi:hypothetical protein